MGIKLSFSMLGRTVGLDMSCCCHGNASLVKGRVLPLRANFISAGVG